MGKPELPDGLYISVSQLKTWLMCPRKYELKYIRGEPPAFVPVNLAFGSAIHEALAAFYSEIKSTGSPLRRELVLDAFRSAWERASDGPVPLQAEEDEDGEPRDLIDKGVSMLHAFWEHADKTAGKVDVQAVEQSFAILIIDVETGKVLEEQLVGTIDLIVADAGRRIVVEHKTAGKKYTQDQLTHDLQPTAYKLAARAMGLGEVGLRYQVITKTKVPAIRIADVHRDGQDEDDFLRAIGGVLKVIDAGVSFPVRGWQCATCPFVHVCRHARPMVASAT